jgi:chorismate mutase
MRPEKQIEVYRRKMDEITGQLISLIHKRDSVAMRIGSAKRKLGIPVTDIKRERKVLLEAQKIAKRRDVDPHLVKSILILLIKHSRKLQ